MKKANKFLIVGLGNPGAKYEHTRHNAGFDAIDKFKYKLNISNEKSRLSSLISFAESCGSKVIVIKPQTFMNNSGLAVMKAMFFYGIKKENIIVVYDDMDIEPGKIRIRKAGSGGSHNGMKSIISHLRTYDFPRVRIGIGKPKAQDKGAIDFVLGRPVGEGKTAFETGVNNAAAALEYILDYGIEKAMQEYNK
ncbi:MAG: aminoacyl-tRNA hydrolase [Clostridia bacterium]|nr:aminoacyl-tRNA hydrolase [Clostridia bacterium]